MTRTSTPAAGRARLAAGRILVAVVLIGAWWLITGLHVVSADALAPPSAVAGSLVALVATAPFWVAVGQTVTSSFVGLALGIVVGVPFGLVIGSFAPVERGTRVVLDIGRSLPVIALLPVMILIAGTTTPMEIAVVFLGVVWPILLQTVYGARRVDPVIRDTVRSFRVSQLRRFLKVLLPSAAPFAATGIRVAAAGAILLALAVEMLARTPGLGLQLVKTQADGRPDLALAYLLWAGVIGIVLNTLLLRVERRVLHWSARGDAEAA